MGEAQRLAILVLATKRQKLVLDTLRIQPLQGIVPLVERLQVFWQSVPVYKESFWQIGNGLAWVRKSDVYEKPEPFHSVFKSIGGLIRWSDYCDAVLAFLPP